MMVRVYVMYTVQNVKIKVIIWQIEYNLKANDVVERRLYIYIYTVGAF